MRAKISDQIDTLIDLLDRLDADSDLELECEDEGAQDDREPDDDEPSLGSLDGRSQIGWAGGCCDDGEQDNADLEPSLGASCGTLVNGDPLDQSHWADGGTDDREGFDDNGIGDVDGLHEQGLDYFSVWAKPGPPPSRADRIAARETREQLARLALRMGLKTVD